MSDSHATKSNPAGHERGSHRWLSTGLSAAIAIALSAGAQGGITTLDGHNIPGPSSAEEAEEWQDRAETYGTGLPVEHQTIYTSNSDLCQVLADFTNDFPNINEATFDVMMDGYGDAIAYILNSNMGSMDSVSGGVELNVGIGTLIDVSLYSLDYLVGVPEVTQLECDEVNGSWESFIEIEVPLTVDPVLATAKSGVLRITGHIDKSGQRYTSGLPVYTDQACMYTDDIEVDVSGLDFWLKAAIKGAVPGYYCENWDDVWPFGPVE